MKKQRGSAAILALVFMLFLAIAGGAWVTMLAQENATAMNDEKEQQAWYAAEAGMKRAKAELVYKNNSLSDWQKWLTQNKDFPSKGTTIGVETGKENSEAEKAKYAVYIGYDETNVSESGMATGKTTYNITSVGYYLDATKIINDTITLGSSGGDPTGPSVKPNLGNNIVAGTGTVTVENSSKGDIKGFFSGSKVVDNTGAQYVSKNPDTGIGSYAGEFNTKMPDDLFVKDNYNYDGGTLSGQTYSYNLEADKTYFFDFNNAQVTDWFTIDATNAQGAIVVLSGTNNHAFNVHGPTSGVPITIVILDTSTAVGIVTNSGICLRLLAAGDFTLTKNSSGFAGEGMFLSNGNMTIQTEINKGYLSVHGDLVMEKSCKSFVGQALVSGNADLFPGTLQYDTTVLDDADFQLPSGMTAN